jgi:hypothetical protein
MITCTKILEYELYPKQLSRAEVFQYICNVLVQTINPRNTTSQKIIIKKGILFSSPLRRAQECIQTESIVTSQILPELREIPFDITKDCTKTEWEQKGSTLIRTLFKKLFIEDRLLVSRKKIFDEIRTVFAKCLTQRNQDITIISHSFRLKIIEAFIKTKGEVEKNPELIHQYIFDDKKTFGFGEGFLVSETELKF